MQLIALAFLDARIRCPHRIVHRLESRKHIAKTVTLVLLLIHCIQSDSAVRGLSKISARIPSTNFSALHPTARADQNFSYTTNLRPSIRFLATVHPCYLLSLSFFVYIHTIMVEENGSGIMQSVELQADNMPPAALFPAPPQSDVDSTMNERGNQSAISTPSRSTTLNTSMETEETDGTNVLDTTEETEETTPSSLLNLGMAAVAAVAANDASGKVETLRLPTPPPIIVRDHQPQPEKGVFSPSVKLFESTTTPPPTTSVLERVAFKVNQVFDTLRVKLGDDTNDAPAAAADTSQSSVEPPTPDRTPTPVDPPETKVSTLLQKKKKKKKKKTKHVDPTDPDQQDLTTPPGPVKVRSRMTPMQRMRDPSIQSAILEEEDDIHHASTRSIPIIETTTTHKMRSATTTTTGMVEPLSPELREKQEQWKANLRKNKTKERQKLDQSHANDVDDNEKRRSKEDKQRRKRSKNRRRRRRRRRRGKPVSLCQTDYVMGVMESVVATARCANVLDVEDDDDDDSSSSEWSSGVSDEEQDVNTSGEMTNELSRSVEESTITNDQTSSLPLPSQQLLLYTAAVPATEPRQSKKSFCRQFVAQARTEGITLLRHRFTTTLQTRAYLHCTNRNVLLQLDDESIDLLTITSIQKARALVLANEYPLAVAARSVVVHAHTQKYVLELPTETQALAFLSGLRWVVARLSFDLVIGNAKEWSSDGQGLTNHLIDTIVRAAASVR